MCVYNALTLSEVPTARIILQQSIDLISIVKHIMMIKSIQNLNITTTHISVYSTIFYLSN